jgi:Ca2+-binding RTX toxin-like protein
MHCARPFPTWAVVPVLGLCALRAAAQAVAPEFQVNTITDSGQFDPAVAALADGRFLVAWHDADSLSAKFQRFSASGTKVGGEVTVSDTPGTMGTVSSIGPRVTGLAGGGAVVAWSGSEDDVADTASMRGVAAQIYDGNFIKVGAKIHVNTTTTGRQTVGGIAPLPDGGFVVTWESAPVSGATGQDGSGSGAYARRFNADGSPAGGEFRVNTATSGDQLQPRISALAEGGFVVVWMDNGQFTFKAKRFSAAGSAVGGEISIGGSADRTAVAGLKDGGFVAIWTGEVGGVGLEACVRQYDADGSPLTSEFQANTYNAGTQQTWGVAALANGGYVVIWTSDGQDGSLLGVYGQKFTPASFNDGGEIRLNVQTTNSQSRAAVAALGIGYVAAWSSNQQDGSSWGVYGRRFGDTSVVIEGTTAADNLTGTSGDDIFNGKADADDMEGLAGNDTYFVDNVDDRVIEVSGGGMDAVRSSVSYTLPGPVENLVLTGGSATSGSGNAGANNLSGNTGNNTLNGGPGNDILTGNIGQDRFLFRSALNETTNVDFVNDFDVLDDKIALENAVFTALTTTGTLAAGRFRKSSVASTSSHRILYSPSNGSLYYDADGTGPIAAIRFARLAPGLALTNSNFIVQ